METLLDTLANLSGSEAAFVALAALGGLGGLGALALWLRPVLRRPLQALDALLSAALVVLVAVLLNALVGVAPLRQDLTANGTYSLTAASAEIAASFEDPCRVVCYFSSRAPAPMRVRQRRVLDLLAEYAKASAGKIRYEVKDPATDQAAAEEAEQHRLKKVTMTSRSAGRTEAVEDYFGMVFSHRDHVEQLQVVSEPHAIEHDVSAVLGVLATSTRHVIGVVDGHAESEGSSRSVDSLRAVLANRGHEYMAVVLERGDPVAERVSVLVVLGPDRLSRREAYEIDQFVMRGGNLLLLVDGLAIDRQLTAKRIYHGLDPLLDAWGVQVEPALVHEGAFERQEEIGFKVHENEFRGPSPYAPRISEAGLHREHAVTSTLSALAFPHASPLRLDPERVQAGGRTFDVLARASAEADRRTETGTIYQQIQDFARSQAERSPPAEAPAYSGPILAVALEGGFQSAFAGQFPPPLDLAVEGAATDVLDPLKGTDRETIDARDPTQPGRVIVAGSSGFLSPQTCSFYFGGVLMYQRSIHFALNAIDWLAGAPELIPTRGRHLEAHPFELEDPELRREYALITRFGAVPLLLVGLLIALVQRASRARAAAAYREALAEGGGRKPGDGERKTDDGERKTDGGERKTDGGERKTDGGERKTDDGERKTDGGGRKSESESESESASESESESASESGATP